MTNPSTTIRVRTEQRARLRQLAEQRNSSMTETLDAALTALQRELFYQQMAQAEASLQNTEADWNAYVKERDEWLNAGLESA